MPMKPPRPAFCAADMIAQAEHDPLSTAILVTDSQRLIADVERELERRLSTLERGDLARDALERQGRIVLVDDLDEAVELVQPHRAGALVHDGG